MAILTMDGILRTIGAVLLAFLLVVYPQRVIRDSIQYKHWPSPEAGLVTLFILVLSVTPAYSIWGIVDFWNQYAYTVSDSDGDATIFAFNIVSVVDDYPQSARILQIVFTCFNLTFIFLFWGGLAHWQGHRVGDDEQANDDEKQLQEIVNKEQDEDDPERLEKNYQLVDAPIVLFMSVFLKTKIAIKRCQIGLRKVFLGLPLGFVLTLIVYFGLSLFAALYLRFLPSQVPLVGIISVVRVCVAPVNDYWQESPYFLGLSSDEVCVH